MKNEAQASPSEDLKKLAKLIDGIKIAMMTTLDENGRMHSRPMVTQQIEFDGDLWFLTGANSHKVTELNKTHQVHLDYVSIEDGRFVSISGQGQIISDRKKAEELWSPIYRAWFPKGLDDPNLVCLKVEIEEAEYWDTASNAMVYLIGIGKALLQGEPYQASEKEHKKINLAG